MKRFISLIIALVLLTGPALCACEGTAPETGGETAVSVLTARPSVNGALHVEEQKLADGNGTTAVLRGLSTHGLTWFPEYVEENLFSQVSAEWDCNLIRLVVYSEEYCGDDQAELDNLLREGIRAAIAADMYILVDWHILNDNDPNIHKDTAVQFFDRIAQEYAGCPNILYEICNEPNGGTTWEDIRKYAEEVIPVIRKHSPDSVIIVGTPDYDRELTVAAINPLSYPNVMYSCHFYAATHYETLLSEMKAAVRLGLPVFVTECGLSESSGDGRIDFANAATWFTYLREEQISFTVWSLSNKPETSAMIIPEDSEPKGLLEDSELTDAGRWVRELIRGTDPAAIPVKSAIREKPLIEKLKTFFMTVDRDGLSATGKWPLMAAATAGVIAAVLAGLLFFQKRNWMQGNRTYDTLPGGPAPKTDGKQILSRALIVLSSFFTLMYLEWRILFSLPLKYGWLAVTANAVLLAVELIGFAETIIHDESMMGMRQHPLPKIADEEYPEVDIFIATYNEPTDLLRRTVNGCNHLRYPDKSKVHVWICDDNRRPEMRALAEEMGVGYFDRPDNEGAKAGNLNHAMGLTHAPYVVTLDADMIPKSDFLLKTIPYFVDAEKRNAALPPEKRASLGLLQTPQCFFDPDVFQHALYAENRAPNEQDFFYRTIEAARTSTNSVIYGGSNTVLARKALEDVGGFFTGSITEDFATGMLIESAGYISLGLSEPLASGRTPHTFKEHIQQRTRWGRGVIVTARKLHLARRKGLNTAQRLSYMSSVAYWFSPVKNLIYMLSPLLFAVFMLPVFRCTWIELLLFWLPMFLTQDISLRLISGNSVSTKWSGIYETSVMPHLLIPIVKESLGITLSAFNVTDKAGKNTRHQFDKRAAAPFLVLTALSVIGIVRVLCSFSGIESFGLVILLFWLIRNLYFLLMAIFLVDGRDGDGEVVHVYDAEAVTVRKAGEDTALEGVTTHMTEHSLSFFPDEEGTLQIGDTVTVTIRTEYWKASISGVITGTRESRNGNHRVFDTEILDFSGEEEEYLQILYDRVPSLPQNLNRDLSMLSHLWTNIAHRLANTGK